MFLYKFNQMLNDYDKDEDDAHEDGKPCKIAPSYEVVVWLMKGR